MQGCSWRCRPGSSPAGTRLRLMRWLSGSSWVRLSWLPPPSPLGCVGFFCTSPLFRYTAIYQFSSTEKYAGCPCILKKLKSDRELSFRMNLQAALPQGIVPFVFAKEYNVHPNILSTAYDLLTQTLFVVVLYCINLPRKKSRNRSCFCPDLLIL